MDTEPRTVFGSRLKTYVDFQALYLNQAMLVATGTSTKKSLSDAVIRCRGQEFPIHRIVLCCHSEYFVKQLDGPWKAIVLKESSEGIIEIVDFVVSLVKAMIYFMYHLNYNIPNSSSAMAFNAKMYQIADKYAMNALKRYAQGEFSISIKECWEDVALPDVISLVYTSTPSSDRGLRDTVVGTSLVHLNILMDRDEFRAELASNADFSIDIIRFQSKRSWVNNIMIAEIARRHSTWWNLMVLMNVSGQSIVLDVGQCVTNRQSQWNACGSVESQTASLARYLLSFYALAAIFTPQRHTKQCTRVSWQIAIVE
ncbi:unnamed protein product [Fusarium graminearum]|nr:unnamed protein product [Fusarium graminearum]